MARSNEKKSPGGAVVVAPDQEGRRLDNFLASRLKGVPESRIYSMIRRGEARVNGGRAKPERRLQAGDRVRVPPTFAAAPAGAAPPARLLDLIRTRVLREDSRLLVIDKPAGLGVHAGTGNAFGVVELLRAARPDLPALQLAHRLDKETSGCLLLAKDMATLRQLNAALKEGRVRKQYAALLGGALRGAKRVVTAPLRRRGGPAGDRVQVEATGKAARTEFETIARRREATYVRVRIATGRTHQIRVHARALGHPVGGDKKYGDRAFNKTLRDLGLKRMFLHASQLELPALGNAGPCRLLAPLPPELEAALAQLWPQTYGGPSP